VVVGFGWRFGGYAQFLPAKALAAGGATSAMVVNRPMSLSLILVVG
jgi:hypothetical protein